MPADAAKIRLPLRQTSFPHVILATGGQRFFRWFEYPRISLPERQRRIAERSTAQPSSLLQSSVAFSYSVPSLCERARYHTQKPEGTQRLCLVLPHAFDITWYRSTANGGSMQYTKLGNTGVTVSRICMGCMSYGDGKWREWTVGSDVAREHFAVALEAGVNFFDTADVYSAGVSEEITGRWLGEMASRDDIVVATKVNGPMGPGPNRGGLSRKHIIEGCDNS